MAVLDFLLSGGTGGILGGITALGNNYLKMKAQEKQNAFALERQKLDNAQDLLMLEKQGQIEKNIQESKTEQANIEAMGAVAVQNIKSFEKMTSKASGWVKDLNASVRGVLTYTTHGIILWIIYRAMRVMPTNNITDIESFMGLVAMTGIFGAYTFMINFWFVSRASEKMMGLHKL